MEINSKTKILSRVYLIVKEENYLKAFLVLLATSLMILAFRFYPYEFLVILPPVMWFIAKSNFLLAIVILSLLTTFAFYHISTSMGVIGLIYFSIVSMLIWHNPFGLIFTFISLFLILLQGPLQVLELFLPFVLLASVYNQGSKTGLILSLSIFLLGFGFITTLDLNSPYLPYNARLEYKSISYEEQKSNFVTFFTDAVPLMISNMINLSNYSSYAGLLGDLIYNITKGILEDNLGIILLFWLIVLIVPTYFTGVIYVKNIPIEAIASLSNILATVMYLFLYEFNLGYGSIAIFGTLLTPLIVFIVNKNKISLSREKYIRKQEMIKDIPGVVELSGSTVQGLEDIGGYEDVKKELKNAILLPLSNPELRYLYNLKPARGILLFGPPGTGKTLLINALAKEISYNILYVKVSELLSSYFGETERNINKLFKLARQRAPIILFFDEIDIIARKRDRSDDPSARALTTLLQELDGIKDEKPIIFIAATNVPHLLDPALLRPGRIDKIIYMRPPNKEERKQIFKIYISKYPNKDIDYDKLAELTERYSGADIANVVKEAVTNVASRIDKQAIPLTTKDILEVIYNYKPSISISALEIYNRFKLEFERKSTQSSDAPSITYKDVINMDELKSEMTFYIESTLKRSELLEKYNIKPTRGILLYGPPGTGKTYFLKATAGEFKLPFIFISASEILREGNNAPAKIREIFNIARERAPSLIVIDEIDTIANMRSGGNPILGQLLQELDGLSTNKGIFFIATTNYPHLLDPALLRPGRIDKIMYIGMPNLEVRRQLLDMHLGKFIEKSLLDKIASMTENYTPADIVNICEKIKQVLLKAEITNESISEEKILQIVKNTKPSLSVELISQYEKFKEKFERL